MYTRGLTKAFDCSRLVAGMGVYETRFEHMYEKDSLYGQLLDQYRTTDKS